MTTQTLPITRIKDPSPSSFAGWVDRGQPVVVEGGVSAWPALKHWSPMYLQLAAGKHVVPTRQTPEGMKEVSLDAINSGLTEFGRFLEQCKVAAPEDGKEMYMPGLALKEVPMLRGDFDIPPFLDGLGVNGMSLFAGRNTRCIGHFHPRVQAALCQVQGTKRVTLYAPAQLRYLYPFAPWTESFFRSRINFYELDRERFPRMEHAQPYECELSPGDVLFIPLHWLHVPTGKAWSVSLTFWWRASLRHWEFNESALWSLVGMPAQFVRMQAKRLEAAARKSSGRGQAGSARSRAP